MLFRSLSSAPLTIHYSILYIIPWAVYGQNVFSGLLYFCNDSSVTTKAECAGEFFNSAVSDWAYLSTSPVPCALPKSDPLYC